MVNFRSVLPIFLLIGLVGCSGDPVDPVKGKIETALLTHIEDKVVALYELQENLQKRALQYLPEGEAKEEQKKKSKEMLAQFKSTQPTDMSVTVIEHDCGDTSDNVNEIVCTVKYERSAKMYGVENSKTVNSKVTFSQTNGVWNQESET